MIRSLDQHVDTLPPSERSSKSQLMCIRPGCHHSEDDHNWGTGPCNHKDWTASFPGLYRKHCCCYAFMSPLSALDRFDAAVMRERDARSAAGRSTELDADTLRLLRQSAMREL